MLIHYDLTFTPQQMKDHLSEFSDADLNTTSQIECLSFHPGGFTNLEKALHRFGDIRQVSPSFGISQVNCVSCQCLRDDRWNDRSAGLPRAIGVEWPQGDNRKVVGAVEALSQLVSADLACRVRRLALEGMAFVDRHLQ